MFYETERIIEKQQRYIRRKAIDVVNSFDKESLTPDEVVACIDVMLEEDNNETRADILNKARNIVLANKESSDENLCSNKPIDVNELLR